MPQLLRVLVCYVVACGLCLECPDDEGGHLVAGGLVCRDNTTGVRSSILW